MQKTTVNNFSISMALFCAVAGFSLSGCGAKGKLYQTPEPVAEQIDTQAEQQESAQVTNENSN